MGSDHRPSIVFMQNVEPESSIHERMEPKLRRVTATFADRSLEDMFLKDAIAHGTGAFLRFSVVVAAAAFILYGIHDAVVVPSVRGLAWAVRYGIFVPAALLTVGVVYSRHLARWHQPVMLLFGMSVNAVVLWIGAIAPREGFFIYTSFAILFVTLGAFIARMSVVTQVVYTLLSMLLYDAFDLALSHSSLEVRLSMNLTFFSMGGIGALVAHQMEAQARRSFLQRQVILEQIAEIDVERQRAEQLLLNILPAPIAKRLKLDSRAVAEAFAEATVMFADIVGFTKMSARLTPEEVVRRLNQIFSAFDDFADELRLEKIKTIGDAYMVAGGLHERNGTQQARAIAEMALRMMAYVSEYGETIGEDLAIRVGIHTGPVVAGVIGRRKFIYDIWGDTVNTASRMESHGLPGRIQISQETKGRLGDEYYVFEDRGEIEMKGKGPMKAWLLVGHKPATLAKNERNEKMKTS
jgi:class 3 adenylate cyclase